MAADSTVNTSYTVRETTTFESSTRPASHGRNLVINRTSSSYGLGGRSSLAMEKSTSSSSVYQPVPEGTYSTLAVTGANSVKESREQEKRDMQDLNSRFSDYLERVRTLEAMNRTLADELEKLKFKWGQETAQIKVMYQAELDDLRRQLDDELKAKARLEVKAASIEAETDEIRLMWEDLVRVTAANNEKFESQSVILSQYESQVQMLRKNIENIEKDRDKTISSIAQVEESWTAVRKNLDDETLGHIDCEHGAQTLEEEIEFLKRLHEQEMKELGALVYSGAAAENRDYWKAEMTQAIREIEDMYEEKVEAFTTTMKAGYDSKLRQLEQPAKDNILEQNKSKEECSEMKKELTELRNKLFQLSEQNQQLQRELDALRRLKEARERDLELINDGLKAEAMSIKRDLDAILRQLSQLIDKKLDLEIEIATYRKLLDAEENRLNAKGGEKSSIQSLSMQNLRDSESEMGSSTSGEMRAKTSFQTTAKGSLSISECPPNAYYVRIENKGRQEESLVGWKIVRTIDGKAGNEFTFNDDYGNIRPGQKITVWAKDRKPSRAPPLDSEISSESWGAGRKVTTKLQNPEGEERATHAQTTTYT